MKDKACDELCYIHNRTIIICIEQLSKRATSQKELRTGIREQRILKGKYRCLVGHLNHNLPWH